MDSLTPMLLHALPTAAGGLITAIWESAVLALLVAGCLRLLPDLSAAGRSVVWSGTFLLTVLLPFSAATSSPTFTLEPQHRAELHLGSEGAYAVVGFWAMLSIVRGAQLLRSALQLSGIARRATHLVAEQELAKLLSHKHPFSLRHTVQLCSSDEVDAPSVVGFFRPQILIPSALLATISPNDLRQIVLHEMEHLRRNDDWTNLLQKLCLVLLPVHPVLLWIERRLCAERELACDDGVLRTTGARKAYALCLVNLAEQSLMRRSLSLALGAWQHRSELTRRVHRILRTPQREIGQPGTIAVVGLTFVSLLGVAAVLTQTPQLITFTGNNATLSASEGGTGNNSAPSTYPQRPAHPTLVSAYLPDRPNRSDATFRPQSHTPKPKSTATKTKSRRSSNDNLDSTVLIRWNATNRTTHSIPVPSADSQFIYAAVPVSNGWLLIKL
jgi:beta-lactamase regulating signal transducer with metallopeptidase domain